MIHLSITGMRFLKANECGVFLIMEKACKGYRLAIGQYGYGKRERYSWCKY